MEIPLGPSLTAFMKYRGLDWKKVHENLRRLEPPKKSASQKKKWDRWEGFEAYPEKSSLILIFVGLGFHSFEEFKRSWQEFKGTLAGKEALRAEEEKFAAQLAFPPVSEVAENPPPPFDAGWHSSQQVKSFVEQRFKDRRQGISPGKAQAAETLWPQLLRNAEFVDEQMSLFEVLCGKSES